VKKIIPVPLTILLLLFAARPSPAQTFEVNGQSQPQNTQPQKPAKKGKGQSSAGSSESGGIGFGGGIDVARQARAAEQALKKGNYAEAANFSEKAVKLAPGNKALWLQLGYASRLAGRYQQSLEAYKHVLSLEPSSADAQSGMAQTYIRSGNAGEARRLLNQVIAANPKRINDVLILGELEMRDGDMQRGVTLLQRADATQPSAHAELLLAIAYMKLKEPEKAKQLLDQAKKRAPRNPEIFRAVANYYRETHDYKSAIATLKSIPHPTPEATADLAYTYELAGDKKESAATYAKAANAAPKVIGYQLSAAQSAIVAGDLDSGKQFLARAESLEANSYRLHAIRALLAKTENRPLDAIREYQVALNDLPQGGVPEGALYPILLHMNLADLYREQGDDAAAQKQVAIAGEMISHIEVEGAAKAEFLRVRASIESSSNDFTRAEADLQEAMKLDPENLNISLQYANLLWKTNRKAESQKMYLAVLKRDPRNHFALESLGYLARDVGDTKTAEKYFLQLAAEYPNDYVPYLALGDLYTATREFAKADAAYAHGNQLAPKNAIIVANAANAAIEAHKYDLAGQWLARATGAMNDDAKVMLERERYLFHKGKYLESAQLGRKVLEKMPQDRNGSVYLGYALYNLGRYDDVLALSNRYESTLPKEPNFPLLAGHVHKQGGLLDEAADDYGRAIARDPKMVEAYVNRGYVENDLQDAEDAVADFKKALELSPNNGIAYLGISFANLELHHGKAALEAADKAQNLLGESGAIHLARATAYRQMRALPKAEAEYRAALKYAPDDLKLNLALADTLYHMRRYGDAMQILQAALQLSPGDPLLYAQLAHAAAHLQRRDQTLSYVAAAEREGGDQAEVLLATGDALLTLGDREAAMARFTRALDAPDANKIDIRLAVARLFANEGRWDDARQQIGLAFAEARVGESAPPTADNLIEAANTFLYVHDFDLSERYYQKARDLGASDEVVAVGLANAYLARGATNKAESELALLGNSSDNQQNFDYQLAMGNLYRQRRDTFHALTAFGRANQLSGDDDVAERSMQEVAGEEGLRLNDRWSVFSTISEAPIFDDATIYMLDAKLFGVTGSPGLLPPPRSSYESLLTNGFRMHQDGFPVVSGFFQVRNARGQVSIPSETLILDRDTFDYNLNGAINPVLRFGRNSIQLNTGLQFTIRRDQASRESQVELDQNLFRQFVYASSNSFGNWISFRGSAYHEAGPFTGRDLNSRDVGAHLEFTVGRPWGKTALVTGYSVRDLQFSPLVRQYFTTSTYAGLQRHFGKRLTVTALGEYLRAWRVQDQTFAIAQAMRPAFQLHFQATRNWTVDGNFAYDRGEGFHDYDNIQSGLLISYLKPLHRSVSDIGGEVPVEYPLRFSIGFQQDQFVSFAGRGQAIFRPVIRLTIF
jgi:tetratricopeptide (TPR) repeat protein